MILPWVLGLVASASALLLLCMDRRGFCELRFLLQLAIFYCNLDLGVFMNVDINTVPPHSGRSVFTFAEETALLFVIVVALSQCGQFQLNETVVDKWGVGLK